MHRQVSPGHHHAPVPAASRSVRHAWTCRCRAHFKGDPGRFHAPHRSISRTRGRPRSCTNGEAQPLTWGCLCESDVPTSVSSASSQKPIALWATTPHGSLQTLSRGVTRSRMKGDSSTLWLVVTLNPMSPVGSSLQSTQRLSHRHLPRPLGSRPAEGTDGAGNHSAVGIADSAWPVSPTMTTTLVTTIWSQERQVHSQHISAMRR